MARLLLLLVGATISASAQTIQFSAVSQQAFEDAGCSGGKLAEQPVKHLRAPNLICTLESATERTIVVGAHFDLVENGDGVVDNWTGASLLPSLYQGMAGVPRRHTFRFVAFSGEEKGLVGSRAYVKQLGKTHEAVSAMVNMDTLGLGETEVRTSHADPRLVRLMDVAAAATNLPVSSVNVDGLGSTDSESFREKKTASITIHSLTLETLRILHSRYDRIENVHADAYYRTYRLVLAYLAVLDRDLD